MILLIVLIGWLICVGINSLVLGHLAGKGEDLVDDSDGGVVFAAVLLAPALTIVFFFVYIYRRQYAKTRASRK